MNKGTQLIVTAIASLGFLGAVTTSTQAAT